MTAPLRQNELLIALDPFEVSLRDLAPGELLGPVDYGWKAHREHGGKVFTFGQGALASSPLQGSRRLVFCAPSPQWETFYISSMGGASYTFQHVGVSFVRLTGRAARPSVLILNNKGDGPTARLEPVDDLEDIWRGYTMPDGKRRIGIYALQQALIDRWGSEFAPQRMRAFVVGPAAARTPEGGIASNPVKKGVMQVVVDWCGRGGLGSQLMQQHNIVGCLFGGEWVDPQRPSLKEFDPIFVEHFGDRTTKVDQAATTKYRFDPKTNTGGTFGSNYAAMGDKVLSFNYRSIYERKEERLKQHQSFIVEHYLKQFNEETIATKNFDHCGETCAVACKKMNEEFKKDYEPYHALGPQVGVFDQRAAEILNDHADAMGFDAIQLGGTLAWIMECVAEGLIDPAAYGLPPRTALRFDRFTAERGEFDIVGDSMLNARYAMALIDAILDEERAAVFRQGIRVGARELDRLHPDTRPGQRAVYLAHGRNGCMVPNQYFVLGMGSPMPIMGKYYVFYDAKVMPPEEVGRRNVERMVFELMNDNAGICRFHRKWSEPLVDEITKALFGLELDFKEHHFELARAINEVEGPGSVPWETDRMADMLASFLRWMVEDGTSFESMGAWMPPAWLEQARAAAMGLSTHPPRELAHAFWHAIKQGQEQAFNAGSHAIAESLTPTQQRLKDSAAASGA